MLVAENTLIDALNKYFGYESFKGDQEAVIRNVLEHKNTFVIMPTGGGKSLCYRIPALMPMDSVASQQGTSPLTLVLSPLS